MADQLLLHDATGNKFKFYRHPIGTNYKDLPGVYAFVRDDGEQWTIVYIGEAESLKDRLFTNLKQHHRYQCAVETEGASDFLTRTVSGTDEVRLDLETRLRQNYDPACNRQ